MCGPEKGLDSGYVCGQVFEAFISVTCNSNALSEELDIVAVRSACLLSALSLVVDCGLPDLVQKRR